MDLTNKSFRQLFDDAVEMVVTYRKHVLGGLGVLCLAGALMVGYHYHRNNIQRAAHRDLMDVLRYFDLPVGSPLPLNKEMKFETDEQKWNEVARLFEVGYKKNASSTLAPVFLAFRAESLINLGKHEEAIICLTDTIQKIADKRIANYYELKLALIKLDTKNEVYHADGLACLEKIALNKEHFAQDQALYQLGLYFWINKKFDEAKNYWQQFIGKFGDKEDLAPMTNHIQSCLDLIAV